VVKASKDLPSTLQHNMKASWQYRYKEFSNGHLLFPGWAAVFEDTTAAAAGAPRLMHEKSTCSNHEALFWSKTAAKPAWDGTLTGCDARCKAEELCRMFQVTTLPIAGGISGGNSKGTSG